MKKTTLIRFPISAGLAPARWVVQGEHRRKPFDVAPGVGWGYLFQLHTLLLAHLAAGGTAVEVFVALFLANHGHLPLKPDGSVKGSPPESDGRVRKRFQFLGLAAANQTPRNRPGRREYEIRNEGTRGW